jgi:hypothetical protein
LVFGGVILTGIPVEVVRIGILGEVGGTSGNRSSAAGWREMSSLGSGVVAAAAVIGGGAIVTGDAVVVAVGGANVGMMEMGVAWEYD